MRLWKDFISLRSLSFIKQKVPQQYTYGPKLFNSEKPFIPFLLNGLFFETDFVFCLKETKYSMIEICRTYLGMKPLWFVLESLPSGEQTISFHERDLILVEKILHLFPLKSYFNNLKVQELDDSIEFTYHDKDFQDFHFSINQWKKKNKKALFFNGNSMNHGVGICNPSIFLEQLNTLGKKYLKSSHALKEKLGVSLSFKISQKVGMFVAGEIQYKNDKILINGEDVTYSIQENEEGLVFRLGEIIQLEYYFLKKGQYFELEKAKVFQMFKKENLELAEFNISLPDLRFRASSGFETKGSLSINKRILGIFKVKYKPNSLEITGLKPFWFKRTIHAQINNKSLKFKVKNEK